MKVYQTNEIKNIALLGNDGSGKTTLTESLLFESGIIKRRGRITAKNTVSDYFPVEQEYGYSVFSTVYHVEWNGKKLNIIDCPGARVAGEYNLPPIEFTYFNPRLKTYETLSGPSMALTVVPDSTGMGGSVQGAVLSGLSKEDIKILGRDIRFIKLDSPHLRQKGGLFFGSVWYFLCIAAIGGLFAGLLVWLRKVAEERHNSALIKGKRANKVALQRFRAAEEHMKADNQRGFYEEMLKALWGYIGDKLNIPSSNLTKENVREELVKRGVSPEAAQKYIDIIVECEYAQYAPAATGRMTEGYGAGVEMVSRLESIIGK